MYNNNNSVIFESSTILNLSPTSTFLFWNIIFFICTPLIIGCAVHKMLDLMGGIVNCRVTPGQFQKSVYDAVSNSAYNKSNKINHRTKTVYLIRHAESNENRRLESFTRSLKRVASMKLPLKDDVA